MLRTLSHSMRLLLLFVALNELLQEIAECAKVDSDLVLNLLQLFLLFGVWLHKPKFFDVKSEICAKFPPRSQNLRSEIANLGPQMPKTNFLICFS